MGNPPAKNHFFHFRRAVRGDTGICPSNLNGELLNIMTTKCILSSMGLLQYYLKSTFCSPRHKSAFGIVRILQTLRHVARIDHHHGQPSEHEIPMRRSPRARRSSLSVADISPSHGCRAGS